MINIAIIGASGYTGAQACQLIDQHCQLNLTAIYVSEHSEDKYRNIHELYPALTGCVSQQLQPLSQQAFEDIYANNDGVVLAISHEVSHNLAMQLLDAGLTVFDLSGAFRFKDKAYIKDYYGFEHQFSKLLNDAEYGLAEWNKSGIKSTKLIAVPGCYPTASLLGLKPLMAAQLLNQAHWPVINAVSGVTGAGRKASMVNSFCEVSLMPYGVLGHRHQPEIATQLGCDVIFTPHLGNFKRGILATITAKVNDGTMSAQIEKAFAVYQGHPHVRLREGQWPKVDDVVNTPFCDIAWKYDETSGYIVITCAIDNLLKGAASQALQCIEIHFDLDHQL